MASTIYDNRSVCQACEKGYEINYDNFCEKMIIEMCDTSNDYVINRNHKTDPMYSYYHS